MCNLLICLCSNQNRVVWFFFKNQLHQQDLLTPSPPCHHSTPDLPPPPIHTPADVPLDSGMEIAVRVFFYHVNSFLAIRHFFFGDTIFCFFLFYVNPTPYFSSRWVDHIFFFSKKRLFRLKLRFGRLRLYCFGLSKISMSWAFCFHFNFFRECQVSLSGVIELKSIHRFIPSTYQLLQRREKYGHVSCNIFYIFFHQPK